jgi:hypothetical protein
MTFFTVASKSSLENGRSSAESGFRHGLRTNSCAGKYRVAMMTGATVLEKTFERSQRHAPFPNFSFAIFYQISGKKTPANFGDRGSF